MTPLIHKHNLEMTHDLTLWLNMLNSSVCPAILTRLFVFLLEVAMAAGTLLCLRCVTSLATPGLRRAEASRGRSSVSTSLVIRCEYQLTQQEAKMGMKMKNDTEV